MLKRISKLNSQQNKLLRKGLRRLVLAEARALRNLRQAASKRLARVTTEAEVRQTLDDLEDDLDFEILKARIDARFQAMAQVGDELDTEEQLESYTEEDQVRASTGGKSLAASLGLAILILMRQGEKEPVKRALWLEDYRVRRMAATEVASSYSLAHRQYKTPDGWTRRWDATLDKKVCKFCADQDGKLEEDWPEGAAPAEVHPNCRCEPHFIQLSASLAA